MSSRNAEADIRNFDSYHPEGVLGPHEKDDGTFEITAYLPRAKKAWVEIGGKAYPMKKSGSSGLHKVKLAKDAYSMPYFICSISETGYTEKRPDPYAFQPELSDYDLHLFGGGNLLRSYETFGAHLVERDGVSGTRFVVWAPNARAVSVVGNFNHWTKGETPMVNVHQSGAWEVFIPEIGKNEVYKYAIKTRTGKMLEKADPYGFRMEYRPSTASIVSSFDHQWEDDDWIEKRKEDQACKKPVLIYEVHLGSWKRPEGRPYDFLNYREIADQLIPYVKGLGFTHIELMPVMEHPLDASWGYQVISYYSPTSRFGSPEDFMYFMDQCHKNNIGVILDWVPAHFPSDEHGLSNFDGTHLYDHEDPRRGLHPDWGTLIFNYGRNEVRNFLVSNALFWIDKFHADGIRIDAVSSMLYLNYSRKEGEWLPNKYGGKENIEAIDFLKQLNWAVHDAYPGVLTIAEESTAWGGVTMSSFQGGLGFDFKWNMGWMHDSLYYFTRDPVYRKYDHGTLTFSAWYAYSEKFILPFSHDEVVHLKGSMFGKMPGDQWRKFANLRLLYTYMLGSPGKKLMFMGDEFGQAQEWNENSPLQWELLEKSENSDLLLLVKDLNHLCRNYPQLYEGDCNSAGYEWIDFRDSENSVISFYRYSENGKRSALFVFNMTPVPRNGYRVGVNSPGKYLEVLNSDSENYGGSGVGNLGSVVSTDVPCHGRKHSIVVTLPPLAGEIFMHEGEV